MRVVDGANVGSKVLVETNGDTGNLAQVGGDGAVRVIELLLVVIGAGALVLTRVEANVDAGKVTPGTVWLMLMPVDVELDVV